VIGSKRSAEKAVAYAFRIGADENGLGARLGPLVTTAVLARLGDGGERTLSRRLPRSLGGEIGDSKQLVSHGDVTIGEAWARVVGGLDARTPDELLGRLALEPRRQLHAPCPRHVHGQCWSAEGEQFAADPSLIERVCSHKQTLATRGVEIVSARSSIVCTRLLNDARERGCSRFESDLHAMERLVLELRRTADAELLAVCGRVGGIGDYSRFFGPLGGWLHATIESSRHRSAYRFPKLGELHFVVDADARDPLVMIASLIGKWVREALMARVVRWYAAADAALPSASGYNDPVTRRFVRLTRLVRRERQVPDACFERVGSEQPFERAAARDPRDAHG
jgi:ribonuclease HII